MMQVDNVMCVVIDPCQANGDDDCENKTEQETRKQAYEWALAFGNGLRVACGKGLERIQISQTQLDELEDCDLWETGGTCRDQGADGVSACLALKHVQGGRCNLHDRDDWSHGFHNDLNLVDQQAKLNGHKLKGRIMRNAHHGPYGTQAVFQGMQEASREYYECMCGSPCEVFRSLVPEFLDDWGEMDRINEVGIEESVFEQVHTSRSITHATEEMSASRFLSDHLKGKEMMQYHTERAWQYFLYMLRTKKLDGESIWSKWSEMNLQQRLDRLPPVADGANAEGIAQQAKRQKTDQKVISRKPQEIAFVGYWDIEAKYIERARVAFREPYALQHGVGNKRLRDAKESLAHDKERMISGTWEPAQKAYALLVTASNLYHVGILVEFNLNMLDQLTLDHPLVKWDSEQANLCGFMVLRLQGLREKRLLPQIRGWPDMISLAHDDNYAKHVLKTLRLDYQRSQPMKKATDGLEACCSSVA